MLVKFVHCFFCMNCFLFKLNSFEENAALKDLEKVSWPIIFLCMSMSTCFSVCLHVYSGTRSADIYAQGGLQSLFE